MFVCLSCNFAILIFDGLLLFLVFFFVLNRFENRPQTGCVRKFCIVCRGLCVYILNQLTLPFPLWYPSKKVRNFKVLSRIELILHYDLKKATYLMYPIRTRFLNPFFQREVLFDSYSTRKIYISFKAFLTYNLLKIEMW